MLILCVLLTQSRFITQVNAQTDASNEKIQIWNPGLKRFVKDKLTVQKAQEERMGSVIIEGKPVFFKNENDLKQWAQTKVKDEDQVRARLEYYSQKLDVVQSCINKISEKSKTVKVEYDFRQCGGYYGNPVNYLLSLKDGFITIDLNLELVYKGRPENMVAVKAAIFSAQPCIRTILANQGIQFRLSYDYEDEGGLKDSFAKVDIYDTRPGQSNAAEWGVLSSRGSIETPNRICTMMTHEILHLLGLGDTYARPNCPQRDAGKPNEIMANSSVMPESAKLTEREIRRIIAPLCPVKK